MLRSWLLASKWFPKWTLLKRSKHLLLLADKIEEIKTTANTVPASNHGSGTQAGKPVYDGEQIQIGGHETFISFAASIALIQTFQLKAS